jgi:TPR repeat protein
LGAKFKSILAGALRFVPQQRLPFHHSHHWQQCNWTAMAQADFEAGVSSLFGPAENSATRMRKALSLIRRAAEAGHGDAMAVLSICYRNKHGVPREMATARSWAERSCHAGSVLGVHELAVHMIIENPSSPEAGPLLAAAAARREELAQSLLGQAKLGQMYDQGQGFEKSHEESRRWFSVAAQRGHPGAQFNLGMVHFNGEGVPRNETEAFRWFMQAAHRGLPDAETFVGVMLGEGTGCKKDSQQSLYWRRRAAEQGEFTAQRSLALSYARAEGIPRDLREARRWFQLSVRNGLPRDQVDAFGDVLDESGCSCGLLLPRAALNQELLAALTLREEAEDLWSPTGGDFVKLRCAPEWELYWSLLLGTLPAALLPLLMKLGHTQASMAICPFQTRLSQILTAGDFRANV